MKRFGAISIGTLLSVVGGAAVAITWVVSYVDMAVSPVQVQANQNTTDIANIDTNIGVINTKLDFILGKYGASYDSQTQVIVTSTSRN